LNIDDEGAVIKALEDGSMNGTKHNNQKIVELRNSSKWLSIYGDKIQKSVKAGETIRSNLHDWWCMFKVKASEGKSPGKGRRLNGLSLLLPEAKAAVQAANDSCMFHQDATPNMYTKLTAFGDLDGDCIDDSWLTEPAKCVSKADKLAPCMTLALFLQAAPTPNSPVKTTTTEHIAN
jgi:hypothetical protein